MKIINTNIKCGYGNIIIIKVGVLTFYVPEFGDGWFDFECYNNYYARTGGIIIPVDDISVSYLKGKLIQEGYNFEDTD